MTTFTLFLGQNFTAYSDDVDDPAISRDVLRQANSQVQNVLYHSKRELVLDNGATFTLDLAGAGAAEWLLLVFRVIGSCRIDTTGTDFDGVTGITGKLPVQGSSIFPGVGVISTYNVSQLVVESLQNGTIIELLYGVACADSDARLTTNA